MTERDTRLTMPEAAGRLRWSVRYLKSRLAAHNIAPIGRGKAARLTEEDLTALEAKERTACGSSTSRPESAEHRSTSVAATLQVGSSTRPGRGLAAALRRSLKDSLPSGRVVAFPAGEKR
jgi:hypothetical protein